MGNDCSIEVETSLGVLRASVVGAGGDCPGIEVWLVKDSGDMGCVSLTEVTDFDKSFAEAARLQTHSYDGASEEPVTIECDPTGPWMSEAFDGNRHADLVVLGEEGARALVFDPGSSDAPFLVVTDFERASQSWSEAAPYSDVAAAACAFRGYPDPEFSVRGFTPSGVIDAFPGYSISYEQACMVCSDLNEGLSREGENILYFADGEAEDIVADICERRIDEVGRVAVDFSAASSLLSSLGDGDGVGGRER